MNLQKIIINTVIGLILLGMAFLVAMFFAAAMGKFS